MAHFLSVANRKGGVGKSTAAVMLAHAFAAWGGCASSSWIWTANVMPR